MGTSVYMIKKTTPRIDSTGQQKGQKVSNMAVATRNQRRGGW